MQKDKDLVEVEEDQGAKTEVGKAAMLYVDGILNGKDAWGYGAMSIIVRGDSPEQLKRHVERVQQECDKSLLAFLREREGGLCGFSTGLIGNARDPLRWFFLEASNVTDLSPLITLTPSINHHEHFSRLALTGMPAHVMAKNRYGTVEYVNYHVDQVGHTLYIGPTSAGKTVQKMMMTSQGFKYPHFRSIIFDKDLSCQAATLLHDGRWVDLMDASDSRVTMNPMLMIYRVNGISWLINWLDRLMSVRGDQLTNKELETLSDALNRLADLNDPHVRLSSLASQLPIVLKDRLSIWCRGGAWGAYFDNERDDLDFASITCFEVGGLMTSGMTDVLRAFTDYVFFRVELRVNEAASVTDIGPTEIYFEEAGYLLDDPIFAARAVNDLMTLRKKQGYLVMTAQSPEPFFRDTYGDKLQAAVRVNVSTVVFLPDANVTRGDMPAMYRKLFGLNNNHLELISLARPKKEYCIYHPQTGEFRVVVMNLPHQIIARLMSNKTSQVILKNTYDPHDPTWKDRYLQQLIQSEFRHVA
jgi:type IV secretion system protein VirB4